MTDWYLGTMGFAYEDWKGSFYPETLSQRAFLKHYSRILNAVEIDSTFYGTPRVTTIQRWLVNTPENFMFCLKTPRMITHDKGLQSAHLDMANFLTVVRELGEKLGVILIQLPPSFKVEQAEILNAFLSELPHDLKFAVEFRHPSWFQLPTAQLLLGHKVCWAATEYPGIPRNLTSTADFTYFRLIGRHGQFQHHDREQMDRSRNLKDWVQNLQEQSALSSQIFGFFNNDYAGFGVGSCNRFKGLAGLPVSDFEPPRQGRLF